MVTRGREGVDKLERDELGVESRLARDFDEVLGVMGTGGLLRFTCGELSWVSDLRFLGVKTGVIASGSGLSSTPGGGTQV
jgi:hypothetical protein